MIRFYTFMAVLCWTLLAYADVVADVLVRYVRIA